jgi:LPS-assembly lipoprotein
MFRLSKILPVNYRLCLQLLLLVSVLSGCGFQLRGSLELSDEISPLYLQSNSLFELARELKLRLATNNVTQTDKPARANYQLILVKENKSRRVLTVDGDGQNKEYLLTYTIDYSINVKDAAQQDVIESISLRRSLLFDTQAVLAVTNESEILYKNMQRDAARLILLKLQTRARQDTATDNPVASPASDKDQ